MIPQPATAVQQPLPARRASHATNEQRKLCGWSPQVVPPEAQGYSESRGDPSWPLENTGFESLTF